MVALLHSSIGNRHTAESLMASAARGTDEDSDEPMIPHQVRGFLGTFTSVLPSTPGFSCCSACSPAILSAYTAGGDEVQRKIFLEKVYFLYYIFSISILKIQI